MTSKTPGKKSAKGSVVVFNSHGRLQLRLSFLNIEPGYKGSMFRKQNHIQIAVINPNCIKGIFLPREEVPFPSDDL